MHCLPQAVASAGKSRDLFPATPGRWVPAGLLLAVLAFTCAIRAVESSEPAVLASSSLLLDVARAGQRLVVVGDRGHVLLSDDEGATWRQVIVPTRAMLTGIAFGDARHGWASGHDGVILATTDGGQTWHKQESGGDLETVFLDTYFRDHANGFVVGAYGQCLRTSDGGAKWIPLRPTEDEAHFNQISAAPDGALYLAGESGTLLASRDEGATWRKLEVPYEGSLFGLLPLDARTLIVYGLRGHVFLSNDAGATWAERSMPVPVLIMAGLQLKGGPIVLAGLGGNFFISRDRGLTFEGWKPADYTGGVASLLETSDSALLVVGERGVVRLKLPEVSRP
jgi:photosystem II stability/assembly factor-like uncharacterized protein